MHVQGVLHGVMEEDDVRALYLWLERLAKNPHTDDEAKSIVAGAQALHKLEALLDNPALW